MRSVGLPVLLVVLVLGASAALADEANLADREKFFYSLVPGVTAEAIVAAVGAPDTEHEGMPAYRLPVGRVVVKVENGWVKWCNHHDPGDCLMRTLYYAPDAPRPAAAGDRRLAELEERIAKRDFAGTVELGPTYTTARHEGAVCVVIDGGYLAVEYAAPLMGVSGAFERRVARATVHRRPALEPVVVWRLFDHWAEARPAGLTDAELDRREAVLRRHGLAIVGESLAETLGAPDGVMGSGVWYGLYYTRAGLVTVIRDGAEDRIERIWLSQPGADRQTTFEEWLAK